MFTEAGRWTEIGRSVDKAGSVMWYYVQSNVKRFGEYQASGTVTCQALFIYYLQNNMKIMNEIWIWKIKC